MDSVVERLIVAVGFKVDTNSARTALSSYSKVATAASLALVAAAGFTVAQSALDDELAKTAHSLSMTTDEFTSLAFVMGQDGVKAEQMAGSLRYLQTQLEAAARDSGEALPWFKRFGIEALDSEGKIRKAADVLPELADEFAKLSDGELMSASLRTLGESGLRMGQSLAQGSEHVRELTADAKRLNVVLTEASAERAANLTDAMGRAQAGMTGLRREISDGLSPSVTRAVNKITDMATASDGVVRVGLGKVVNGLAMAIDGLSTPTGAAIAGIAALGVAVQLPSMLSSVPIVGGLATAIGGISAPAWAAVAVLGVAVVVVDDLATAARGGDSAIMDMAESLGVGKEASDLLNESLERGSHLLPMLTGAMEAGSAVVWAATKPWRKMGEVAKATYDFMGDFPVANATADYFIAVAKAVGWAVEKLTDFESATRGFKKFAGLVEGKGLPGAVLQSGAKMIGNGFSNIGTTVGDRIEGAGKTFGTEVYDRVKIGSSMGARMHEERQELSINPTVTVNAGASEFEAANAAAEAVRSQVLGAFAVSDY